LLKTCFFACWLFAERSAHHNVRAALRPPRLEAFRANPGTLEERLWKRYKWDFPPDDECAKCWWVAVEEADQTQEARLICRSLAALRMELCGDRLATSRKLRLEWDKRLDDNALAVDRLQANRNLWMHAGGCDPELLATPAQSQLDEASRTLAILNAMLEENGPSGGLDSFVAEIKAMLALLLARARSHNSAV